MNDYELKNFTIINFTNLILFSNFSWSLFLSFSTWSFVRNIFKKYLSRKSRTERSSSCLSCLPRANESISYHFSKVPHFHRHPVSYVVHRKHKHTHTHTLNVDGVEQKCRFRPLSIAGSSEIGGTAYFSQKPPDRPALRSRTVGVTRWR